jgi:hypothetical protein
MEVQVPREAWMPGAARSDEAISKRLIPYYGIAALRSQ